MGVARICAAHGIRGEVRVEPLTDRPEERLSALRHCRLRHPTGGLDRPVEVLRARPGPRGLWLVQLAGCTDRNQAEALVGAFLEIPRASVAPLEPGRYYLFEVVGATVVEESGELVGQLEAVIRTGAHDVWTVRRPDGRELLVPAVRDVVRTVDTVARRIVVRLLPGME